MSVFALNRRSDLYSRCAVIIKVKMRIAHGNNIDISVKSAVESEVRHLRINGFVGAVVNGYGNESFVFKVIRDINSPC